jgi:hypothetical protein
MSAIIPVIARSLPSKSRVFPRGSSFPNIFSADSRDSRMEVGFVRAVSGSPFINGNEKMLKNAGSIMPLYKGKLFSP